MSPRRNRRPAEEAADTGSRGVLSPGGHWGERVESWPDGDWRVRAVTGGSAKTYRCPGCDQEITPGVPHVVAWPDGGPGRVDERRHWHRVCWTHRDRRRRRF